MPVDSTSHTDLLSFTVEIVTAYVSNNTVDTAGVPQLIQTVFDRVRALAAGEAALTELVPAVPIRRSVTDEYIVCLEDGRKLKMLKRYLMSTYDMTPEQYRAKWGLKPDYPMIAPAYSRKRQELAVQIGLGRKPASPPLGPKGMSKAKPKAL